MYAVSDRGIVDGGIVYRIYGNNNIIVFTGHTDDDRVRNNGINNDGPLSVPLKAFPVRLSFYY